MSPSLIRCQLSLFLVLLLSACSPSVRFTRDNGRLPVHATAQKKAPPADQWLPMNNACLAQAVQRWKGTPYLFGGLSEKGIDCSGFVKKIFWECNRVQLPRNSREQAEYGRSVRKGELAPGDILFFKIRSFKINHVGIYIGDGRFAHASTSEGVTVTPLEDPYYKDRFVLARRLYTE